jgi:SulP family sulfate permease
MSFSNLHEFIPKSYLYLRHGYTISFFKKDLIAGVTVGLIALPLAMAFAIASGVSPEKGLYTAIIAGFLISALGGSRIQIGGPTGAFVVIIYGIIHRTGYSGLCISTLLAGLILISLGITRIGSWIKYIPTPLITGFTSGIAILIFSTQIKDFLGLQMSSMPPHFIDKWTAYIHALPSMHLQTFMIGAGTLTLILLIRRYLPKLPWGIISITVATLACVTFPIDTPTIYSQFGVISKGLPSPSFPHFSLAPGQLGEIFMDAIAIAFLGGIESLLSAVIGDGMIGGKHRSNCELIAQGIANIGSILFGGIPATGAIARTATNAKTGAKTPLAGIIHAITILLILCFLTPIVSKIPLAALAAVLIMVSWNMSEIHHFLSLLKAPYGDRIVMLVAFFLTIFVDITAAIFIGMTLASFLFMKRMSEMSKAVPISTVFQENSPDFPEKNPGNLSQKSIPPEVEVYEIQGPFFFGAAHILKDLPSSKVFILHMQEVPVIDASGMFALEEFYKGCKITGTHLLISGIDGKTRIDLKKFGLLATIGEKNIFSELDSALDEANALITHITTKNT